MMLMMTGHFSPKLVSQILRAVVQQKPVMKSMKACFPHSLSNSTDISESQIYWAGVKWNNGKCELKRAVLHNIDCNITAGNLNAHNRLSCACSHCSRRHLTRARWPSPAWGSRPGRPARARRTGGWRGGRLQNLWYAAAHHHVECWIRSLLSRTCEARHHGRDPAGQRMQLAGSLEAIAEVGTVCLD